MANVGVFQNRVPVLTYSSTSGPISFWDAVLMNNEIKTAITGAGISAELMNNVKVCSDFTETFQ